MVFQGKGFAMKLFLSLAVLLCCSAASACPVALQSVAVVQSYAAPVAVSQCQAVQVQAAPVYQQQVFAAPIYQQAVAFAVAVPFVQQVAVVEEVRVVRRSARACRCNGLAP